MPGNVINIAAFIGAVTTIGGFIVLLFKSIIPLIKAINQIADDLAKSKNRDIATQLILKDMLSMRSTLIIQRGWHTATEQSMLQQGLESYQQFGGNGQVQAKIEAALLTELRVDQYYVKAQQEIERHGRENDT